jgi:hypothetical protein
LVGLRRSCIAQIFASAETFAAKYSIDAAKILVYLKR